MAHGVERDRAANQHVPYLVLQSRHRKLNHIFCPVHDDGLVDDLVNRGKVLNEIVRRVEERSGLARRLVGEGCVGKNHFLCGFKVVKFFLFTGFRIFTIY
ncbi:hypothetical protein LR48_Vigan10g023700 [Vigna angularis]|uniref:Uncharacterized protein n=1 Tax=Phaseolus angularis TaxID=3914 RepID=A0A0L9VGZ4_PHAAN|nr:hypothetical protein LR48_Vigan10g023700 [Vigna angularis]